MEKLEAMVRGIGDMARQPSPPVRHRLSQLHLSTPHLAQALRVALADRQRRHLPISVPHFSDYSLVMVRGFHRRIDLASNSLDKRVAMRQSNAFLLSRLSGGISSQALVASVLRPGNHRRQVRPSKRQNQIFYSTSPGVGRDDFN